METIISAALEKAVTYSEYRRIVSDMLAEGKSTGDVQSEDLTHYSLLNQTRMNRLEKTIRPDEEAVHALNSLGGKYTWLVLSEGWCGDAAQIVPVMEILSKAVDTIELRIVFRDENPELMNLFLTNGARSIPKLVALNSEGRVVGHWGPRPKPAAELIARHKAEKGIVDEEAKTDLQLWYLHDKGISTQRELAKMMVEAAVKI